MMRSIALYMLGLSLCALGLWSCANQRSLSGGPKDETAPQLNTEQSTPNEQVQFEKQTIELYFDEFIEVKNAQKQVLVSPPLQKSPKIFTRGKKVVVEFPEDEVLKEDATYVFNFGNAIVDFNEANPYENFRFVFSTGDYIDSLEISGTVVNAYTGKPEAEVLVMMYDAYQDSVVYQERPFYFASTDTDGKFLIPNIRQDSFKIFALKDGNVNYLYDQDTELVGYVDSLIYLTSDSIPEFNIEVYQESTELKIIERKLKRYGRTALLFSDVPKDISAKASIDMALQTEVNKDSLIIWYDLPIDTAFSIFLEGQEDFLDTVRVRKLSRSKFVKDAYFDLLEDNLIADKLSPFDTLNLSFSSPIMTIDTARWIVRDTAQNKIDYNIIQDTSSFRAIQIWADWQLDSLYQITLLDSSVVDIYGQALDSITIDLSLAEEDQYGDIFIEYDSLATETAYILQLRKAEEVLESTTLVDTTGTAHFEHLLAGSYNLLIIEDRNANGKWDPGNYLKRTKPERILRSPLSELKPGWEMKVTFTDFELTSETEE